MKKHFMSRAPGVLVLLWALASASAHAQMQLEPTPVTGEARMVTFEYDDDRTYKVLIRPRNSTQIKFAKDERITYVSAGDTANFLISVPGSKTFVEVKPKFENMTTNLLVETTKRSYHIDLQSTAEGKKWYMRVAWVYSDVALMDATQQAEVDGAASESAPHPTRRVVAAATEAVDSNDLVGNVAPENLNFRYAVKGEAPFKPAQVFDDGTFTYIRLPDDLQELPALFMKEPDSDEMALVNYSVRGPYLVAQRVMQRFMLKIGKTEVSVDRLGLKRRRNFDSVLSVGG